MNSTPKVFDRLFDLFEGAGFELYMVGGCVRDLLLNMAPKDFDFATDATPTQVKAVLESGHLKVLPIGEAFGTIATLLEGVPYEITTYRVRESYKKGSRHPQVVFGSDLREDLGRRDLTINAMAMSRDGELVDPYGGREDLAAGCLRVPGGGLEKTQEIFADDPLRLLRVGRFAARFDFEPDDCTTTAAQRAADTILEVSRERWKSELDRLLVAPFCEAGLYWLAEVGVLFHCLPELEDLLEVGGSMNAVTVDESTAEVEFEVCAFEDSVELLNHLPARPLLRWAGLLHAVGLARHDPDSTSVMEHERGLSHSAYAGRVAERVARRLKASNEERASLSTLLALQGSALSIPEGALERRVWVRRLVREAGDLELFDAILSFDEGRAQYVLGEGAELEVFRTHVSDVRALASELAETNELFVRLPTGLGSTLMEAGFPSGRRLGEIMEWLSEEVLVEHLGFGGEPSVYVAAAVEMLERVGEVD